MPRPEPARQCGASTEPSRQRGASTEPSRQRGESTESSRQRSATTEAARQRNASARRPRGVCADGMLLLDKPDGLSSNRALQVVKRLLNARKAGHTGSLDPIATGLLPLCFGATTRVAGLFLGADKTYWARLRLGIDTDTGDREGRVQRQAPVDFTERRLEEALQRFRGGYAQIPPMYSALKRDGRPLYKLARQGLSVEREPRQVSVYALRVEKWHGDLLDLTVSCSRGFYLRALAKDLGEALGCGAHVSELRRTKVGDLCVQDAWTLPQLEALDTPAARRRCLLPTERSVAHLPELSLADNIAFHLCRGRPVRIDTKAAGVEGLEGAVRVYSHGAGFLGIAEVSGGKVTPKRLFHHPHPRR